jgi:hypothetical protein
MDINHDDEALHLKLGPIERYAIPGILGLMVFLLGFVFHNFDGRLAASEISNQAMLISQAATNAKLDSISSQLTSVPSLTVSVAELKVQTDRNSSDIHDLQETKKLR